MNMKKKVKNKRWLKEQGCCNNGYNAPMGFVYSLGFIGAIVYYLSTATSFWMGVLGVLKALVWPAFLTYEVFKFLGM